MSLASVLVVEDSPLTRKMYRLVLATEGYRVIEAGDGRTALACLAAEMPDLVLQDLHLPDMDGVELIGRLRGLPAGARVPVLAISGFISPIEGARVSSAGFDEVLLKPIEPSRLVRILRKHLPVRRAPTDRPGEGRRVLVVDDDPVGLKLTLFQLARLGFDADTAAHGEEALAKARARQPDLILSDVLMPRLDGFGLCVALRKDPALQRTPIVLMSADYIEDPDRELALRMGANAFVLKSADGQTITDAVLANLQGAPPSGPQPPKLGEEHARRALRQLEKQVANGVSLAGRVAILSSQHTILMAISEALATGEPVGKVLHDALAGYLDAVELSMGAFYLTDPDGQLVLQSHVGIEPSTAADPEAFYGHPELFRRALSGNPILLPSSTEPTGVSRAFLTRVGVSSALLLPLIARTGRLGVLLLGAVGKDVTDNDFVGFARAVASQLALSVALAQTFQRLRLLESVVVDMNDAVIVTEPSPLGPLGPLGPRDPRIEYVNEAFTRMTGYTKEEALGKTPRLLHGPRTDREAVHEVMRALEQREPSRVEILSYRKDGSETWVDMGITPVFDEHGELSHVAWVLRDITEQRRAQEAALRLAREEQAVRVREDVLAVVSHDLKNPLSTIKLQAHLIRRTAAAGGGAWADRVQAVAERVARVADQMSKLIAQLLDLGRIEGGELRLASERVDLRELMTEVAADLQPMAEQQMQRLDCSLPDEAVYALVDRDRISQVLWNLLGNAIKFTLPGGALEMRVERVNAGARISVSDTGPGIPAEQMAHVFERYWQSPGAGRIGTGLGLFIVRGLVEAHGGRVWCESQVGKGSTFYFTLPAVR